MTDARVYVGTYAKYNSGNLDGAWLDLDDYSSADDFLEACAELHADEKDPEFMFQDYEGFPSRFYSESNINEDLWEFLSLSEHEQEVVAVYWDHVGGDFDSIKSEALDALHGEYDSVKQFADEIVENAVCNGELTQEWANHIDSDDLWSSSLRHDYFYADGFIFSRM